MEENKSLTQNAQTNLQTFSQAENLILQEKASFGNEYAIEVFDRYQKAVSMGKAVSQEAPTLFNVRDKYSERAILFWLRYHIAQTFAFLGIYDTSSKYQVRETAELILQHEIFGQLTTAEFLNFLQRFKQGRYGKIYQSARPNPQEFLQCLTPFWNELTYYRRKQWELEQQEKLEKENKGTISWEEYQQMKRNRGEETIHTNNPLIS